MKTENKALPAGPWQFERRYDGDPYTWIYRDTEHGKEYLLKISNLPAAGVSPQPCEDLVQVTMPDSVWTALYDGGRRFVSNKQWGAVKIVRVRQGTVATVPPQAETDLEVR